MLAFFGGDFVGVGLDNIILEIDLAPAGHHAWLRSNILPVQPMAVRSEKIEFGLQIFEIERKGQYRRVEVGGLCRRGHRPEGGGSSADGAQPSQERATRDHAGLSL